MPTINETTLEYAMIDQLKELGFDYVNGMDIAPDSESPERDSYSDVVLNNRLKDALYRINPTMPDEAIEEAFRKITIPQSPNMLINNKVFHKYLTEGVDVEYREGNETRYGKVWTIDFKNPADTHTHIKKSFNQLQAYKSQIPSLFTYNELLFISDVFFVQIGSL